MNETDIQMTEMEQELAKELTDAGLGAPDPEPGTEAQTGTETTAEQETQPETGDSATEPAADPEPGTEAEGGDPAAGAPAKQPGQPEESKLILGKFKTQEDLEKAYVNLEKMASKKAAQISDAQKFADPDNVQKMIIERTEMAAQKRIEDAIATIQDPEHLKEATAAFAMYRRTGDMQYIEKARGFLDRRIDRRLDVDMHNDFAQIASTFNQHRTEIEMAPIAQALQEMDEEDPEWMSDPVHQKILADAIRINRKVDVKSIKRMIVEVGENAVKKYVASEAKKKAAEAQRAPQVSVASAGREPAPAPKKDWRNMTIEEQLREELANS